jgi:hypothetical protein
LDCGVSKLDREIWDEFHADWERLAVESEHLRQRLAQTGTSSKKRFNEADDSAGIEDLLVQLGKYLSNNVLSKIFSVVPY